MLTFVLDHRIYRQIVLDREIGKEGACRELEQGRRGKGGGKVTAEQEEMMPYIYLQPHSGSGNSTGSGASSPGWVAWRR